MQLLTVSSRRRLFYASDILYYKILGLYSFNQPLKEDVMKHRTHGYVTDSLGPEEEEMGKWWRSEDTILSENPYTGFIVRKDWPLKEAINMHFVRLQQESHQGDYRSLSD